MDILFVVIAYTIWNWAVMKIRVYGSKLIIFWNLIAVKLDLFLHSRIRDEIGFWWIMNALIMFPIECPKSVIQIVGIVLVMGAKQVCRFWLQGRCTSNPCPFLHPTAEQRRKRRNLKRRNPDYSEDQKTHPPQSSIGNSHSQPRSMTWKNVNAKNQVCNFWLQGRCTKNPCKFMDPSPKTKHTSVAPPQENANSHPPPKKGPIDKTSVLTKQVSPQPKVEQVSPTQALTKVEKRSQPSQCKNWVIDNCVHGYECKHLHSWFCGQGFTMLGMLEGHTQPVTGISLPSASNKLFSGGKDRTVRAWDCSSGKSAGSIVTDSEVGCLVSEGPWVFVGLQNAVKAWNIENNTEFSLNAPCGLVCCMAVDDDYKLIAGMEDGSILVWKQHPETKILKLAAMAREHDGAVSSLVLGANNRLYSGSKDCTIKVWDRQNMRCIQSLSGHKNAVKSVLCWDSYLLSASLDNTLKVWARKSGTIDVIHEIKEDHGVIALCGICDAEDRPILLCSLGDNTVRLYDLPTFRERGRIFSKREVEVISTGIDGLFFTGDATGEISVWKLH